MKVTALTDLLHDGKEYKKGDSFDVDPKKMSKDELEKEYSQLDSLLKKGVVKKLESEAAQKLEPVSE